MRLPRLTRPQIAGAVALLIVSFGLIAFGYWGWSRYQPEVAAIAQDRHSLAIAIGLLTCLYLFVVFARVTHEPQYAHYILGRLQEAVYLGNWKLAIKALAALGTVGASYWMSGWSVPTGLLAWAMFLWAIASFIKDVSGAWLRPVQSERYFFTDALNLSHDVNVFMDETIGIASGDTCISVGTRKLGVPGADWSVWAGSLMNGAVNRALQDENSALCRSPLERATKKYRLPDRLTPYREAALINARSGGALLYNETKIRLGTDLETALDGQGIVIQKTTYFDFVCSNGLTRFFIAQSGGESGQVKDMFKELRSAVTGRVVSLARSELSNHLGGGTIAITRTGKLLLSKQGRLSLVASGQLAGTGSGSFDWADQKGVDTLAGLVRRALERELLEECDYTAEDLRGTHLLGFARDLKRGGKPDFFAVTLVSGEPKVSRAEVGFIDQHESFDLDGTTVEAMVDRLKRIENEIRNRASAGLLANMHMLVHAEPHVHQRIFGYIGG